jgi:hypothetical protein
VKSANQPVPSESPRSSAHRYLPFLPAAVAVILSLPVLGFTYLWDDYSFLTNAMFYRLHDWMPNPVDPFYRPISRGVYFTVLDLMGRSGAAIGHLLNLGFLVAIIFLLGSFTARVAGRKAGVLSGLILAGLGAAPTLVGWVCCDQDLLAILFFTAALHFRLEQRNGATLLAAAAGLLSKETTLAVIPALVLFDWIADRKPYRLWKSAAVYAALVAAWGAIHPAVRILLARGLQSGATGYVGLQHPDRWLIHMGRYLLTLFNLPAYNPLPSWPVFGVLALIPAFAGVVVTLRLAARQQKGNAEHQSVWPRSRVMLLGVCIGAGPLLLTSTMIRGWSPYYATFPALGLSMIAGVLLATLTIRAQMVALAIYFTLGMWSRGDIKNLGETAEPNFRVVSSALRQVESGFRKLYPSFPHGTQVVLSVQARGAGVYTHMYLFQVLRIWYRDRSIRALRPEETRPTTGPEVLAVVTPDRDVIDINPRTLAARSASGKDPDYNVCEGAVRAYAMGLAGSGATNPAVQILLHMPEVNVGLASVHRRMAAMFLIADGRAREAQAVLDSTVALPREIALADLNAVLAEQPNGRTFDDAALRAFGIAFDDADALRHLMRWFTQMNYAEAAIRFAHRLQELRLGDREADDVIRSMTTLLQKRREGFQGVDAVE